MYGVIRKSEIISALKNFSGGVGGGGGKFVTMNSPKFSSETAL